MMDAEDEDDDDDVTHSMLDVTADVSQNSSDVTHRQGVQEVEEESEEGDENKENSVLP